jgi:hypothetical protein
MHDFLFERLLFGAFFIDLDSESWSIAGKPITVVME